MAPVARKHLKSGAAAQHFPISVKLLGVWRGGGRPCLMLNVCMHKQFHLLLCQPLTSPRFCLDWCCKEMVTRTMVDLV